MTLHLLRPFTEWNMPSMTVMGAVRYVEELFADDPDGEFGTWTSRPPKRVDELAGGQVFFVQQRRMLFRMPFLRLAPTPGGGCWILMKPEVIPTVKTAVGMVRGWRYLADADAPGDLINLTVDYSGLPDHMQREFKELGL